MYALVDKGTGQAGPWFWREASGGGYLGAALDDPLVLLRAQPVAQPGTTKWFDPPAAPAESTV